MRHNKKTYTTGSLEVTLRIANDVGVAFERLALAAKRLNEAYWGNRHLRQMGRDSTMEFGMGDEYE